MPKKEALENKNECFSKNKQDKYRLNVFVLLDYSINVLKYWSSVWYIAVYTLQKKL